MRPELVLQERDQAIALLTPVDLPCGVLTDSLFSVTATTADGNRRLSDHFERSVAARCWTRN